MDAVLQKFAVRGAENFTHMAMMWTDDFKGQALNMLDDLMATSKTLALMKGAVHA